MARKTLNLKAPFERLKYIPFRLISRSILGLATLLVLVFVSWMIYRIYIEVPDTEPVVLEQRTELLQTSRIEELETYIDNPDVPAFPASIFPTTDISIIP
jgi:hypothetical protein